MYFLYDFHFHLQDNKTTLAEISAATKLIEEECLNKTKETLQLLNEMRIKFPGKTDEEAKVILSQVCFYLKFLLLQI